MRFAAEFPIKPKSENFVQEPGQVSAASIRRELFNRLLDLHETLSLFTVFHTSDIAISELIGPNLVAHSSLFEFCLSHTMPLLVALLY